MLANQMEMSAILQSVKLKDARDFVAHLRKFAERLRRPEVPVRMKPVIQRVPEDTAKVLFGSKRLQEMQGDVDGPVE
jgi:hypothetical protein